MPQTLVTGLPFYSVGIFICLIIFHCGNHILFNRPLDRRPDWLHLIILGTSSLSKQEPVFEQKRTLLRWRRSPRRTGPSCEQVADEAGHPGRPVGGYPRHLGVWIAWRPTQ